MLNLYNTISGKKEAFKPRSGKKVNLFVCGPTVYDYSHIGHARTYIFFDLFTKYLKTLGYGVFYLQNITDIDDKIIKRAQEENMPWQELSKRFEKEYFNNMKTLGVNSVKKYARATDHVKEIIGQVKRLLNKKYAYQIEDGIYYNVKKFKNYGKLSGRTAQQAEDAVSRIDESKEKINKGDFCLWKVSKNNEPGWPSPWQKGRPGWHIEDTAITEKYFGPQYDIHGGGGDLIFPHHEAEIAQMEAISKKKPLVKYWLHTGFLTVQGKKMSKSLGNFITINDFLKNNSARTIRLLFLKNHYRSPIDYNENDLKEVKSQLERIDEFTDKIKKVKEKKTNNKEFKVFLIKIEKEFNEAMADDINTPKAIASIFKLINQGNALISQNKISNAEAKKITEFLKRADLFLNFVFNKEAKEKIPAKVLELIKERAAFRREKNWQKSDEIRDEIKKLGYWVEDTKEGIKIKKL